MYTLFDLRDEDTNVPSDQHGLRLGTFFLSLFGDFDDYYKLRKPKSIFKLMSSSHKKAKNCPMRGKLRGK